MAFSAVRLHSCTAPASDRWLSPRGEAGASTIDVWMCVRVRVRTRRVCIVSRNSTSSANWHFQLPVHSSAGCASYRRGKIRLGGSGVNLSAHQTKRRMSASQFRQSFSSSCSTAGCPGVDERYFKFSACPQPPPPHLLLLTVVNKRTACCYLLEITATAGHSSPSVEFIRV